MSKITETECFPSGLVKTMLIFTGFIFLLVIACFLIEIIPGYSINSSLWQPWVLLVGHNISDGIEIVSLSKPEYMLSHKIWDIGSILIYFWLAPALFFYGLKNFILSKKHGDVVSIKTSKLKIYISGLFLVNLLWGMIDIYYFIPSSKNQIRESEKIAMQDIFRSSISQVTCDAIQHYIKNHNYNSGVEVPALAKLPDYEWIDKNRFQINPIYKKDTVFVVTLVTDLIGEDKEFQNKNGEKGKMQLSQYVFENGTHSQNWDNWGF